MHLYSQCTVHHAPLRCLFCYVVARKTSRKWQIYSAVQRSAVVARQHADCLQQPQPELMINNFAIIKKIHFLTSALMWCSCEQLHVLYITRFSSKGLESRFSHILTRTLIFHQRLYLSRQCVPKLAATEHILHIRCASSMKAQKVRAVDSECQEPAAKSVTIAKATLLADRICITPC